MVFLRPNLGEIDLTPSVQEFKARVNAMGIMFSVIIGYTFFVTFITKVGINHFLMKVEMDLAKEIHEVLVPNVNIVSAGFDIFGKSIPTNEVGGDLIDVIENDNKFYCIIADVSGHGVSSGVYTGMFKSSIRTILQSKIELNKLLSNVNKSLCPLMKKNMFITTALIKFHESRIAEFTIAGHLPILHYKRGSNSFDELMIKQLPIGFKSDFEFNSHKIEYNQGDIFLLITDGLTETTDRGKNEFGIERIKEIVAENNNKSAEEITNSVLNEVHSFGDQKDDVTLLLVKC